MAIGVVSKLTDAAVAIGQVLKVGSDDNHVAVCGAADAPRWVALQAAAAGGDSIQCQEIGTTRAVPTKILSAAAILQGAFVEPAAAGQVQTLTGSVGTHHVIGWCAGHATGAGQLVDIVCSGPWERVI